MRNTITPFLSIGHVIYEMSSGHVLSGVFPTEEEYERVEYEEVKELLHFIFNLIGKKLSPQKMIMKVAIIIVMMLDIHDPVLPMLID